MKASYQSDIGGYSEIFVEFKPSEKEKANRVISALKSIGYEIVESDGQSYTSLAGSQDLTIDCMKYDWKKAKKAAA